jgi:uncharacterized protein YjbJ (UPF0337 family)
MSSNQTETPESARDLKGRVKEAAGDLTGNSKLKHDGKVEQAAEKLKAGVDDATKQVKELLERE